jgi:hypothetical protein
VPKAAVSVERAQCPTRIWLEGLAWLDCAIDPSVHTVDIKKTQHKFVSRRWTLANA